MKISRQGQAKVLTEQELHNLFTVGLLTPRDHLLFGICLYTGCRVGEACSLAWVDVTSDAMTFRIEKTKTKSSRTVAITPALQVLKELQYDFPQGKLPDDITKIINLTYSEVIDDYENECYISAISLCGKIIETVLNSLFVKIFDKNPDEEKLGFNAMLNRLKKKKGMNLVN
ncbi:tyrosine-type recombinase/integrase (plasmid) [Synechocystis sp. B12]|nr:tyrosine-type recombinase/integrase [Synechocystis sp. B12]